MRAVIYTRQSLAADGDELAVTRQLAECERVAQARGYGVVKVISDNDVSASHHGRQGYGELLELMKSGEVDSVLILRIDRLLRLNDELEELIQLVEQYPVKLITVEGDIDISTPQGRLIARILVSVARNEIEVKSARHKLANRQKAEAGKPHGSRRPYGYNDDQLTLNEPEAAILKQMAERVIDGGSVRSVAAWLNEQGIMTTEGKQWWPITVRNMLRKPRYGGIRTYNGEVVGRGNWQPVFDPETWQLLQLALTRRHDPTRPIARKYLLTGLLYCGKCNGPLNGETKRDAKHKALRPVYNCRSCFGVVRNAPAVEEWLRQCVIYRLDTPDMAALLHGDDASHGLTELLTRRESCSKRLDMFTDDYADGTLTKQAYTRSVARVQADIAAIDREVNQVSMQRLNVRLGASESFAEAWARNDNAWRRSVLALLIDRVVIMPSSRKPFFDMPDGSRARLNVEAVEIFWKL